jgi:putative ABC transport system ATP-binding protein
MASPLLVARGLSRSFVSDDSRFTLEVDELVLAAGNCVAVVGPSGCGKSTLLGLLSLALRPDAGDELTLVGTDALSLWKRRKADSLAALRARRIGFVPQSSALLPYLTVRDNIGLPQAILGRDEPREIEALAQWLGIGPVMKRRPGQISVGQRQRVAVARALAHRPPIILADEPTASVHPAQADEILSRLVAVAADRRAGLIITTHDGARAEAAGFYIAPCRADKSFALTRFGWTA